MTAKQFSVYIAGPRPDFSKRIRITEPEFRNLIKGQFGVSLEGSGNKDHAHKIFELRRFYFKISPE